jgi:hypothetical protein
VQGLYGFFDFGAEDDGVVEGDVVGQTNFCASSMPLILACGRGGDCGEIARGEARREQEREVSVFMGRIRG